MANGINWKRAGRMSEIAVVFLLALVLAFVAAWFVSDDSVGYSTSKWTSIGVAIGALWAALRQLVDAWGVAREYLQLTRNDFAANRFFMPITASLFSLFVGVLSAPKAPSPPTHDDVVMVRVTTPDDSVQYVYSPALVFSPGRLVNPGMQEVRDHLKVPVNAFEHYSVTMTTKQKEALDKIALAIAARCNKGKTPSGSVSLEAFGFASDEHFGSRRDSDVLNLALSNFRVEELERQLNSSLSNAGAGSISVKAKKWDTLGDMTRKRNEMFDRLQITYSPKMDYRSAAFAETTAGSCVYFAAK